MFSELISPEEELSHPDQSRESSFLLSLSSGHASTNKHSDSFNLTVGELNTPQFRGSKKPRLFNRSVTCITPCSHNYIHSISSIGRPNNRSVAGTATITPGQPPTANLISLVEGRGMAKGQIGMASLDLKSPELVLSQFPDTQTYARLLTKLHILQPVEIVLPATLCQVSSYHLCYSIILIVLLM